VSNATGALALGVGVGVGALIAYLLFPWKQNVACPYGDELAVDGTCASGYQPDPNYPGCCEPEGCPGGDIVEPESGCPDCFEPDPNHPGCCQQLPCSAACPGGYCADGGICAYGICYPCNCGPGCPNGACYDSPFESCCSSDGVNGVCCGAFGTNTCCNEGGPIGCNPCSGGG